MKATAKQRLLSSHLWTMTHYSTAYLPAQCSISIVCDISKIVYLQMKTVLCQPETYLKTAQNIHLKLVSTTIDNNLLIQIYYYLTYISYCDKKMSWKKSQ